MACNASTGDSMKTKIGGQAVLEGVMMRGASSMALAVRDESGNIRMDTTRLSAKKPWYRKVPFLRGIVNLFVSMVDGTKIIGKSAEVMVEDEIDTTEGGAMGGIMAISMVFGVALAIGLFVFLPTFLTDLFMTLVGWKVDGQVLPQFAIVKPILEGVLKIAVLVGYMLAISQMKEIKRVFMYHGAEHKTIACYEAELPLTVENVKKCSRYHDRCGTSFLVFVVVLSVFLMIAVDAIFIACNLQHIIDNTLWRFLIKVAMLPLTAGFSYEMLMLLANTNFVLFRPLKWLGKQFQKITTREPDDSMCEVAISAFNKVLQMDADPEIAEEHFPDPVGVEEFCLQLQQSGLAKAVGTTDMNFLAQAVLHVSQEDLNKDIKIPFGWTLRLHKMVERIENGEPVDYVLGSSEFFGRIFRITKDVLIPRQETQLVAEQMLKQVGAKTHVLDLCTGSGVLGITAQLEKGAKVTLADVSKKALEVAKHNAKTLKAKVRVAKTDMFANLRGKWDVIVCNPPYIETDTISTLDDSVKNFEPHLALDGGADGLKFYKILAEQAPRHLKKGGVMVLEIGYNQGHAVANLLQQNFHVEVQKDYSNNDRIVVATLKNQ